MHPETITSHVNAHTTELMSQAAAHRQAAPVLAARGRRRIRRRAGWWLVGVGLKLAVDANPQVKVA